MFEAFLGIVSSLRLFRFYYQIIHNKKAAGALGSFYFKFQDANKRVFPFLATKDASQIWSKEWFYSTILQESRITHSHNAPPEWSPENWVPDKEIKLSDDEKNVVLVINNLVRRGLTGRKIVLNFLKNRISPLQKREILSCNYDIPEKW